MRFHWLRLRATAHATEDPERVRRAIHHLTGLEQEEFDARTEEIQVDAHHGGDVRLFETNLTRARDVRRIITELLATTTGLMEELEARTDDDGVLYLRFDKQAAFAGRTEPTRGDDSVQVRIRPEVHPAKRELALEALRTLIETGKA